MSETAPGSPYAGSELAGLECDAGAERPVYSAVVRFKVRQDDGDKLKDEEIRLARKYNDRPYLLVITSANVQLFATRAADFSRPPAEAGSEVEAVPAFIARTMDAIRPLAPMTAAAATAAAVGGKKLVRMVTATVSMRRPAEPPEPQPAADDLPADAVSTLGVALSQVVDVRQAGSGVQVAFRRQHPSTRLMDRAERLLMPWADRRGRDPNNDPLLRTCMLGVADEAAAAELVAELQAARLRLDAAVRWIANGLPLNATPAPTLVLAQPAGAAGGAELALSAGGADVLAAAPAWGCPIPLPARWAAAAERAAPADSPALVVLLYTPLGPAVARLGIRALMDGCRAGEALVVAEALPLVQHAHDAAAVAAGWEGPLRVQLQAAMQQDDAAAACADGERPQEGPAAGGGAAQPQLLLVGAVAAAVLGAWLQLLAAGTGAQWLAFLLCNVAAAAAAALVFRRGPAGGAPPAAERARWTFKLLQASLVAAAEGQQVAAEAGVADKEKERGDMLPPTFRQLVGKHPDVLDENMALRFFTSYPSPNKAYVALQQCVEWRRKEGMVRLLDQPQPAFERIKRLYPHAVLGWSRKKDCLVTLDSYGVWKQSYDAMRAEGVSEDALLRHLMLCFDFNFSVLDARPLPHGKSVNIIDLSGLKMSDAAGEAFRFISKAGALLNLHFPLRLHKAFLINAPGWWSVVWRLVSPLIDSKTRELMALYPAKDKEGAARAMLEWIDADVLPVEYGGDSTAGLYDSELEQRLWAHVRGTTDGGGASAAPTAAEQ